MNSKKNEKLATNHQIKKRETPLKKNVFNWKAMSDRCFQIIILQYLSGGAFEALLRENKARWYTG